MAGGTPSSRPEGMDGIRRILADHDRRIRALAGANGLESAVIGSGGILVKGSGNVRAEGGTLIAIDPDTGSAAVMLNGRLRLYPTFGDAERYGYISVPLGEDTPNQMWISPPRQDRTRPDDTRLILRGSSDGATGYAWLYSGGGISLNAAETLFLTAADNITATAGNNLNLNAGNQATVTAEDLLSTRAERIELVAEGLGVGVFGTPTTSAPANVVLATVEGQWQLARSTSSRRYKQDIEGATVDPAEVLTLAGRTWRDKNEVDAPEGTDRRFVGFIAEELDERPSLRQFVDYDEDGRPDAIQYDRLTVALLEVAKDQQSQLDTQAQQIADLTARLDALEGAA